MFVRDKLQKYFTDLNEILHTVYNLVLIKR